MNEELRQTNDYLDEKVSERTKDLLKLNESLIHYSFINAHKVRTPLARIMSLVYLLKIENEPSNTNFLLFNLE